jgi:uncharacterized protein YbjT (DUF2867 family)
MERSDLSGKPIAVFGAAGAVGEAVARALIARGRSVRPVTRRPQALAKDLGEAAEADLTNLDSLKAALEGAGAAIFPPILTLSVQAIPALRQAGLDRVVFFSSHNLSVPEAAVAYAPLLQAEATVKHSGLQWTLLRPTLIYGDPRLTTMNSLFRLAKRLPMLPCPGMGTARQQPIFLDDLARVAAWSVAAPEAVHQVLSLGGPDVMSLRAMYAAVSRAAGGTGLVAPVPFAALRIAKRLLNQRFPLNEAQLARAGAHKHVPDPPSLPRDVQPSTALTEGLSRLALAIDQTGAQAPTSQSLSAPRSSGPTSANTRA